MARLSRKLWHPEEIKAAVRMRGTTLTQLALDNGLPEWACRVALVRVHHDGQEAIARFLRMPPKALWPGRYHDDGRPRTPRRPRKSSPAVEQDSSQKDKAA